MPFRIATLPAKPDRANEDFAAVSSNAAVLLDGAGTPPGTESGCLHGVSWYARTLGALLLSSADTATTLADGLAESINRVAAMHAGSCDLKHHDTPSATVVATRWDADQLDYLVLADSTLLLDHEAAPPEAVSDDREAHVARDLRREMDAQPTGSAEHAAAWRGFAAALSEHRNAPDGFWVAGVVPEAAYEALTGRVALDELNGFALLSDGATRLTDRFKLTGWNDTLRTLRGSGPAALLREVREVEDSDPAGTRWPRAKQHDDATAVHGHPQI